jgi:hypothetical protein
MHRRQHHGDTTERPPVTFIETYGALGKRIARCKDRPLTIIDQKLTFMP